MRSLTRNLLIGSLVLPLSFTAAYFSYPLINPAKTSTRVASPLTKFTENLTQSFEIKNANATINRQKGDSYIGDSLDSFYIPFASSDTLSATFSGSFGLQSMTFEGDLNVLMNNENLLSTNFIYDSEKIYLGLSADGISSKISFTASSLFDLLKAIPTDGMDDLSSKLGISFNISELSNILTGLSNISDEYIGNDSYPYHFELPIPFLNNKNGDTASLIFGADSEYQPKNIVMTSPFLIDNFLIDLNVEELIGLGSTYNVESPSDDYSYENGDNIISALSVIPNLVNLIKTNEFSVNYKAQIYEDSIKQFAITGDFGINLNKNQYEINTAIEDVTKEKNNVINLNGSYLNEKTYINLNNGVLKGYISNSSIETIIDSIEDYLNEPLFDYVMDLINDASTNSKINEIISNVNSISKIANIFSIRSDASNLFITIDTNNLGIGAGLITIAINHDSNKLNYIFIKGASYDKYSVDLTIGFNDLKEFKIIDENEYCSLDSLASFATILPELINKKQYALNAEFALQKSSLNYNQATDTKITVNAQADVTAENYYGTLNISEPKNNHYIQFNLENNNDLYVLYDSADRLDDGKDTKFKFDFVSIASTLEKLQTFINKQTGKDSSDFLDLGHSITDLLNNPELLQYLRNTAFNLTSENLTIKTEELPSPREDGTDKIINIQINGSLFGLGDNIFNIYVGYSSSSLNYIEIANLFISDIGYINGKLSLVEWSSNMTNSKLSTALSYYDFNDVQFLLELGINTADLSLTNYWHLAGTFKLDIIITITIEYDIYIKNNNSKIEVIMSMTIPQSVMTAGTAALVLFDGAYAGKREATIYYCDSYLYLFRKDYNFFNSNPSTTKYKVSLDGLINYEYPIHFLTKNLLTFSSTVSNKIDDSIAKSKENAKTNPTKYEQVLQNLSHDKKTQQISISLNFAELTNNPDMTKLDIVIKYTNYNGIPVLDSAKINMTASVGIDINMEFNLSLEDTENEELLFVAMYDYINQQSEIPSRPETSY